MSNKLWGWLGVVGLAANTGMSRVDPVRGWGWFERQIRKVAGASGLANILSGEVGHAGKLSTTQQPAFGNHCAGWSNVRILPLGLMKSFHQFFTSDDLDIR